jgi:hypothetical protein
MNTLLRPVLVSGLLLALMGAAHGQICSESTLHGSYAYSVQGYFVEDPEAPPVPYMSIAIATFDYHGNDHAEGTINTPVGMLQSTADGTVEMAPDCTYVETYTMEITDSPPMVNQQERCAVLRGGAEINCASLNMGNSYHSHAIKMQSPGRCDVRMLRGDFAFVCTGSVPSGQSGAPMLPGNGTGIISYDHKGEYSGSVSSNYLVAIVPRTFDGKIEVDPDCTATWSQTDQTGAVMSGVGILATEDEMFSLVDGAGAISCVMKRIWGRGPAF